jgi:putative ABC transport system permease protein
MIRNYFKIAWRNLFQNKTYSFLNVFGLTIGFVCAALIFLWVEDEVNFDKFNAKKDVLFYVQENMKYDTYVFTHGSTPGLLGPAIQEEIPGIANTCRTNEGQTRLLFSINDNPVYASGKYVEPSIFDMFTLPFIQGNAINAFKELHSIVLTEKTAKKFFGNEINIVGQTIKVDNEQDYIITGILKDIPENSSLKFEWLMPFKIYYDQNPWLENWRNNGISTYVELKPNTEVASVDKILKDFIHLREPTSLARPFLWSMNDWRLYNDFENGLPTGGGRIEYVQLFTLIAWIILIIACINFMNLATARSEKRSREVGVRKVLGARKIGLIAQFTSEALLLSFLASLLAILIIILVLPFFNLLVEKQLGLVDNLSGHLGTLLLLTLLCGIIAGSYPSLYLSSFKPVDVLKGLTAKDGGTKLVRKGLVIVQFSASIILIIGTIVIYQQIQHVKNRPLGMDKSNIITTSVVGDIAKNYASIKKSLFDTGLIEHVALSDYNMLYGGNNTSSLTWDSKSPDANILVSTRHVSPDFMKTSGIKVLDGRDFQPNDTIESLSQNIIITRSFEKLMGDESAVGKIIRWKNHPEGGTNVVVGVVNDYVYGNMYGKPDPVLFFPVPPIYTRTMYIRTKEQSGTKEALAKIGAILKKANPAYPFDYRFVDEQFNQMFRSEMLVSKLSRVFAIMAILISCLGIFGLAAHDAERKTKEIGIRKVLGASVSAITVLMTKEFVRLVILSCVVAFPLGWWVMDKWLLQYEYRIGLNWQVFVLVGLMAIVIALLTVSFQAFKAAISNPVKALRTE